MSDHREGGNLEPLETLDSRLRGSDGKSIFRGALNIKQYVTR